jgi:prepilin-type N-terminal cleavage/methylation domain-containing protein
MEFTIKNKATKSKAFTLVEMLIVLLLISILMTLMVPAVNALLGISGPRGGVNSLAAAIDNAKLAAMENGVVVYLAFPTSSSKLDNAYSHMIIFREAKPGDTRPFTALSRWMPFPRGVFFESDDLVPINTGAGNLPPLQEEQIQNYNALAFDCFGRLVGRTQPATIRIGEKAEPTGDFIGDGQAHFRVTVQPLTGRSSVDQVINN